jgi:hypothetical protein
MVLLDAGESRVERYWQNDNPQILDIVGKMTVTLEGGHADENYTRIEVTTLDGRRIRREGEHFAYDRWNDREEMRKAGEGLLPAAKLERACDLIERLPELDDVGELMACLTP